MDIIGEGYVGNTKLSTEKRKSTERIILHHSASNGQSVEDINNYHKKLGWGCIGYHFYVRKDGKIYRGRKEEYVGAHAYGSNYNSIGVCAEGNFETDTMPEVQKESLKELVAYLKNKYNITKVQKHSDVCKTACPGKNYPFEEIAGATEKVEKAEAKKETSYVVASNVRPIAEVQKWLNANYSTRIAEDNIYGKETKKALVKALQTELNKQTRVSLVVDGIFGAMTKAKCINVKRGDHGNITKILQGALICHGYSTNGFDGLFGAGTEKAVRSFQVKNGLAVDGIAGKNTFEKILK